MKNVYRKLVERISRVDPKTLEYDSRKDFVGPDRTKVLVMGAYSGGRGKPWSIARFKQMVREEMELVVVCVHSLVDSLIV